MAKRSGHGEKLLNPLATARNEYLESEAGMRASDPATLGANDDQRRFLRNRIEAAFIAGWEAKPCCFTGAKRKAK